MKPRKDISSGMQILRRWISGEADAHDEQALRVQAGDDPFLQDAVEGLEAFPEGAHAERVTRLKAHLRQRTGRRAMAPVLLIRRMAAAAVVVGLAGLGIWWMLRQPGTGLPDKTVAMQEETIAPQPQPAEREPTVHEITGITPPATTAAPQPPARSPSATSDHLPAPAAPPLAGADYARRESAAGPPPVETETAPAIAEETSSAPPRPAALPERATAAPAQESKLAPAATVLPRLAADAPPPYRTLIGKVTDAQGEPLIGASIVLQGTSRGTITDLDGAFQLNIPVDAQNVRLQVSYTGYTAITVDPGIRERLNITLDDSGATLSEVVVSGYKATRNKQATASASVTPAAQPEGGFQALNDYIQRNKRPPGLSCEVELEFTVSTRGKLNNFKVLRSPSPACSEEAIRLLRSGPRWQNRSGKEQPASYTVSF